jgi:uncharacterized protein (DUF433 family)
MIGLGTGIYSTTDAAALLHEQPATVRRWAFGYERGRGEGRVWYPPLIRTELPSAEGEHALTFVELVELLYIRAFRRAGASWQSIKEAARVAARLYDSEHPFALRQLFVDADQFMYGAIEEADGSEGLIQLRGHGQHAFPSLVKPYLEQLEFDFNDVASRWWPLGRGGGVVINPELGFGAPRVEAAGIQTETLWAAYDAEKKGYGEKAVERVAWVYDIDPRDVDTALRFRKWLRAA